MNITEKSVTELNEFEGEREIYELFINEVKSNLRKEKYKKVLEDIEVGERNYSEVLNKWQILDIKITTLFKIFDKFLYQNDVSIIKDFNSVENFLNKIDRLIEAMDEVVNMNEAFLEETQFKFQFESVITSYLTILYNYALIAKKDRKCGDCCAYLGIAENLVKYFSDKIKNNKFLYISTQVYLFISSLLISDEEYYTAQTYQKQVLCIAFRIISYLNGNNQYIQKSKVKRSHWIYMEKAILAISVAFYHRGFCQETLGNLLKATESYAQARWFSNKFLIENYPEYSQFLCDVDMRVARDTKIWLKSQNNVKHNPSSKNKIKNDSESKRLNEMDFLKMQYRDTINKIEQLKFPDFDEERRGDHKVQEILYTLKMNNYLMTDEFKKLVLDMEKLNIHKIDKDTKDRINKRIVQIRARESYERFCNVLSDNEGSKGKEKRLNSAGLKQQINLESNTNINSTGLETVSSVPFFSTDKSSRRPSKLNNLQLFNNNLMNREKSASTTRLHTFTDKFKYSGINTEDFNQNNQSYRKGIIQTENSMTSPKDFDLILPDDAINYIQTEPKSSRVKSPIKEDILVKSQKCYTSRPVSSFITTKKDELKRYNYNKFIFNDTYQKKLQVLSNNFNKELDFQKRLLRLKKNEKILVEEIDFKKKADEYNFKFIKKIKDDKRIFFKKKEIKYTFEPIAGKKRNGKQKYKLEQILIRSLESKKLSELRKLKKEKDNEKIVFREDSQFKQIKTEILDNEKLIKEAKNRIQILDMEMDLIKKITKQNLKELHPIMYKEKPYICRKPIVEKTKREYNENFTRIRNHSSLSSSLISRSKSPALKKYMSEN